MMVLLGAIILLLVIAVWQLGGIVERLEIISRMIGRETDKRR